MRSECSLAWLGSKALKVVMESLSDLHIDGQLLLYCAEAARLGQSSENGPSREMLLRVRPQHPHAHRRP